ncbi:MAG: hypothetical protein IPQ25_03415 [Chitinophagaceae bacterium]|nr:hypothetical protein [Chitinophagaceae bacterium]
MARGRPRPAPGACFGVTATHNPSGAFLFVWGGGFWNPPLPGWEKLKKKIYWGRAPFGGGFVFIFFWGGFPRLVSNLLEQKPLLEFKAIGFSKEDDDKIGGYINNYKIFLAPLINVEGEKWLTVLIPLQVREGLDNYFNKFDDFFKFQLSDKVLFAEAILKSYDKTYDYQKIFTLLEKTTLSLQDKKILPINIVDE